MRIIINDEAKKRIRETARYIHKKFGKKARLDFKSEIEHIVKLLHDNPSIGPAEPYLADAPVLYRSIVVNHLNKMVYWIDGDVIEIVDFWDCRCEPKKQAEQIIPHSHSSGPST
jgi:plasmid stabilization system protein ParE